eukprot:Skav232269  [mRNA]  locus=scaffold882:108465:113848:- [translate_table: standard]
MAPRGQKDALFFNIRDSPFSRAEKSITNSTAATLNTRYKPRDQTTLFFAAARQSGQDTQALALCRRLLERGVPVNHADELGQTALFYAARQGHTGTIKYLLRKGADPNIEREYEEMKGARKIAMALRRCFESRLRRGPNSSEMPMRCNVLGDERNVLWYHLHAELAEMRQELAVSELEKTEQSLKEKDPTPVGSLALIVRTAFIKHCHATRMQCQAVSRFAKNEDILLH